ncbi:MAG: hypothetical protein PHV63_04430 [Candidatus Daviesbacteria bacterium]|nr:hypothetical protein [Candidatus Daviesbacteria bacterium]
MTSLGRISDFGPRLEGPLTGIVNEGPVYVEVYRRVVKKRNIIPAESWGANTTPPLGWTEGGVKEETSLQDYPALAKVFQG